MYVCIWLFVTGAHYDWVDSGIGYHRHRYRQYHDAVTDYRTYIHTYTYHIIIQCLPLKRLLLSTAFSFRSLFLAVRLLLTLGISLVWTYGFMVYYFFLMLLKS